MKKSGVDVFGKVRCNGQDEESGGLNPPPDEIDVHEYVRGHLAIPVSRRLKFVETILEGIFVVGSTCRNGC